jgi:hypothetical protein
MPITVASVIGAAPKLPARIGIMVTAAAAGVFAAQCSTLNKTQHSPEERTVIWISLPHGLDQR